MAIGISVARRHAKHKRAAVQAHRAFPYARVEKMSIADDLKQKLNDLQQKLAASEARYAEYHGKAKEAELKADRIYRISSDFIARAYSCVCPMCSMILADIADKINLATEAEMAQLDEALDSRDEHG